MDAKILKIEQGTPEWHALRKTKITATDASVIMGPYPWKTKLQLFHEKISDETAKNIVNARMQRGLDLEPVARELFQIETGIHVKPCVVVKDWAMASLDGMCAWEETIIEIKCPGEKDHALALAGKIPAHYYPQLQHQMYVTDLNHMFYFSFDGIDGVTIRVERNDEYIQKMIQEEQEFYACVLSKIPPEKEADDYTYIEDEKWEELASRWTILMESMQKIEQEQELIKKSIIELSGQSNAKGAGISLCQVYRKGNVDYSQIPELKNVDLDAYRKPPINSWRISSYA